MLKIGKQANMFEIRAVRKNVFQKSNSGNLRMNGLFTSFSPEGNVSPYSSGSSLGETNKINELMMYMPAT